MTDFVLWGRVEQTGATEWLAIATALDAVDPSAQPVVETRTMPSRVAAEACLKEILTDLGEAVRAAGGRISDVETDGV